MSHAAAGVDARVFGLDLTRALAVLMVLVAHGSYLLAPAITAHNTFYLLAVWGVELFFVLSGFLVGGIVIDTVRRDPKWLANFWLRRWMRTLPNYWLFVAINAALWVAAHGALPSLGLYVVFMQNLLWPHPPFFPEAWSLAIEEVFYLVAPLVAMVLLPLATSRTRVFALLLLSLLTILAARFAWVMATDPAWDEGVRKVALIRLDCIVYGVVASYVCRRWVLTSAQRRGAAVGGVALAIASSSLFLTGALDTSAVARTVFFAVTSAGFAALLPLASTYDGARWPDLPLRAMRRTALWSYSLYLTHLPVVRIIELGGWKASTLAGCIAQFLAFCVVSIAWAALTYRFWEKPFMAARDRVAARLGISDAA
jgi:peptidoglycan/LPS O-acetylase OafA/YrhL